MALLGLVLVFPAKHSARIRPGDGLVKLLPVEFGCDASHVRFLCEPWISCLPSENLIEIRGGVRTGYLRGHNLIYTTRHLLAFIVFRNKTL